jgi:hypothetical protein
MRGNYRTLKWAVLGLNLIFASQVFASEGMSNPDSLNQQTKPRLELNTIVNPIFLPFMANTYHPMFGFQMKLHNVNHAWRISGDYRKEYSNFFGGREAIDVFDGGIRYLNKNIERTYATVTIGYQRSKSRTWGSFYLGVDAGLHYGNVIISANNFNYYIANDSTDLSGEYNDWSSASWNNFGAVVKPFVGLGVNLGKGFGFNFEARTDIVMTSSKSFEISDESEIIFGEPAFYFYSQPLLDIRLSYTFGNGRK